MHCATITAEALRPSDTDRSPIAIDIEESAVPAADLDEIIASPIGTVCRGEIAALGSLLFDTVGTPNPVADVVRRIAGMDGGNEARRAAILDEVWKQVRSEGDAGWR